MTYCVVQILRSLRMTVGSNDIVLFVISKLFCHSERLVKNLAKRSHEHIENKIKNVSNLSKTHIVFGLKLF